MSTLGLRLAYAIINDGITPSTILYRYHSDDCAADGIRLGLKQLDPNAQFEVVKERKHQLIQICNDETSCELTISKAAMDIAWKYRSFCERTTEDKKGQPFWQAREALLETTLARLKSTDSLILFSQSYSER